ncbi:nucleoside triphosphate pyrophosphohydrolase family protein [Actinoplanes sp. M2I2]|uniref:nucleoside triphosphate pyrophosphohydrolase family protein n=1 Tax=Actinoplanes sp. M2I2 TaxID=1734444 RepID=UPI0020210E4A|nr:nucleoside triphosphate pyrophosphohydrolase family protein [Actinoplanes sp. M2I2]
MGAGSSPAPALQGSTRLPPGSQTYRKKACRTACLRTAAPRDKPNELLHLVLGLVGESGEIAEKFKKWVRDRNSDETLIDRADIAKELGDVLWYVAALADYLDLSLDDIAAANLAKLASREARGLLGGSGDNR